MPQKKHAHDEGFILVTVMVIIFLMVTIVASVILITSSDLKSNANARQTSTARLLAESVSDTIFSQLSRTDNNFIEQAQKLNFMNPDGVTQPTTITEGTSDWGNWYQLDKNGNYLPCENLTKTCFRAYIYEGGAVESNPAPGPVRASELKNINIHIVVRFGCLNEESSKGCKWNNFFQRMEQRAYSSQVISIGTANNSYADSKNVAFLPGDIINNGEIGSNGDLYKCGDVSSVGDGFKSSSADKKFKNSINVNCGDESKAPTVEGQPVQLLPGQLNSQGQLNDTTFFEKLAGIDYTFPGGTKLTLDPKGIKVGSDVNLRPYPYLGVVFVNGDVEISGAYSQALSVYATGSITITNNITYASPSYSVSFNGEGPAPVAVKDYNNMLGLAAGNNIYLKCNKTGTECDPLNIVGILNARNGSVINKDWKTSSVIGDPPKLTIYGSIIAKEQPVVSSYTSTSNYQIVNGWTKNYTYDARLQTMQPPYFFRTTQASIFRTKITQGQCSWVWFPASCGSVSLASDL